MLAALMSQSIDSFSGVSRRLIKPGSILATTKDIEPGHPHHSKGKRSRRRRAARIRAQGFVHCDGLGWTPRGDEVE